MELLEKVELVSEKCGVSYEVARESLEAHGGDVLDAIVAIERGEVAAPAVEAVEVAAEEPEDAVGSIDEVMAATEAAAEAVAEVLGEETLLEAVPVADEPAHAEPAAEPATESVHTEPTESPAAEPFRAEPAAEPRLSAEAAARASRREARRSKVRSAWRSFWSQFAAVLRSGMAMTFVAERHGEVMFSLPVLFLVIGMLAWGATLWLLVIGLFFGFRYRIEGASPVTVDVNKVMDRAADLADDIRNDVA